MMRVPARSARWTRSCTARDRDLEVDYRGTVDRLQCTDPQRGCGVPCSYDHAVEPDRIWPARGARPKDAGQGDPFVSHRVRLQDVPVGQMQPGQDDQLVARLDAMQGAAERG